MSVIQGPHPSHVRHFSMDVSTYDEICVNCLATNKVSGGWGKLTKPCPKPIGKGGITYKEWLEKDRVNQE